MNTKIEMNSALTDRALNDVVGGSFFSDVFHTVLNVHPAITNTVIYATPWGQVGSAASAAAHTVASVVKHFKFW